MRINEEYELKILSHLDKIEDIIHDYDIEDYVYTTTVITAVLNKIRFRSIKNTQTNEISYEVTYKTPIKTNNILSLKCKTEATVDLTEDIYIDMLDILSNTSNKKMIYVSIVERVVIDGLIVDIIQLISGDKTMKYCELEVNDKNDRYKILDFMRRINVDITEIESTNKSISYLLNSIPSK